MCPSNAVTLGSGHLFCQHALCVHLVDELHGMHALLKNAFHAAQEFDRDERDDSFSPVEVRPMDDLEDRALVVPVMDEIANACIIWPGQFGRPQGVSSPAACAQWTEVLAASRCFSSASAMVRTYSGVVWAFAGASSIVVVMLVSRLEHDGPRGHVHAPGL